MLVRSMGEDPTMIGGSIVEQSPKIAKIREKLNGKMLLEEHLQNKLLVTRSSPRSGQPAKQTMRTVHKSFTEYGICTV